MAIELNRPFVGKEREVWEAWLNGEWYATVNIAARPSNYNIPRYLLLSQVKQRLKHIKPCITWIMMAKMCFKYIDTVPNNKHHKDEEDDL